MVAEPKPTPRAAPAALHRPRRMAVMVILFVGVLIVALWVLSSRQASPNARAMARAIASGYGLPRAGGSAGGQVDTLPADEIDEGYMWARSNGPSRASGCPTISPAFRKGCADYVNQPRR